MHPGQDTHIPVTWPGAITYWFSMWNSAHRPAPLGIFHYTDAAGLQGIVSFGCLWATHIHYLTDSQEFRHGYKLTDEIFGTLIDDSDGQSADRLRALRKSFQGHFSGHAPIHDAYVVCFCENGDLLSQWRAYAADGNGFALEFEPSRLWEALKRDADVAPRAKLLRVFYDVKEQQEFIRIAIEHLLTAFTTDDEHQVLDCVPGVFLEMLLCFKHSAFVEEHEWRLVFSTPPERFLDVRVARSRLLPYASLRFCGSEERPPYVSVTHGTTLEAENTKKAIQMLLGKANRYWNLIRVLGSDAPLRPR